MDKRIEIYLNLLFSFLIIPAYYYDLIWLKLVIMIYAIVITLRVNAIYLPALIVISSYLLSSYLIYFAIILLLFYKYSYFQKVKLKKFLNVYLLILLISVLIIIFNFFISGKSIVKSIDHFQLVFALSAFFYGVLLFRTFNRQVVVSLYITFILLFIFDLLDYQNENLDATRRLYFFIVPFFISLASVLISLKLWRYWLLYLSFAAIIIYLTILETGGTTFTLLLTSIYSLLIAVIYFRESHFILNRLTGITAYLLVIGLVIFGIMYYENVNYNSYRSMQMHEVKNVDDLTNRFLMKFFEDRGSLWGSTINQIIKNEQWLPKAEVDKIVIISRYNSSSEFDFHSHNIFIELFRRYGILFGAMISVLFIFIMIRTQKLLRLKNVNTSMILFVATAYASVIIGGSTGIYILLFSYAIFGLGIFGLAYTYWYFESNRENK